MLVFDCPWVVAPNKRVEVEDSKAQSSSYFNNDAVKFVEERTIYVVPGCSPGSNESSIGVGPGLVDNLLEALIHVCLEIKDTLVPSTRVAHIDVPERAVLGVPYTVHLMNQLYIP